MMHPALRIVLALGGSVVSVVVATQVGFAQQATDMTPNLVAVPADNFSIDAAGSELRFSTTSWNNGAGPLELRAGEAGQGGQDVYQRIYRSDGSYHDRLAGTFVFHEDHGHFHFENYALYTLRPLNAPGASDRQSSKTTFCIIDTTRFNTGLPGAPANAVYTQCESTFQGMSVGWGDTYVSSLEGQSFNTTGSPDGDYELLIQIDPQQRIVESNESDNLSCWRVRIGSTPTGRTVQSLGACTTSNPVTVSSITPNSGSPGASISGAVIKGSGFAAGMAVGFENGSGPAPTAKNVQVVDANTITLTISIKAGGSRRERLWDVRVGSGVLPKGFKVVP
jgi:Lysyl oxidase